MTRIGVCRCGSAQRPGEITNEERRVISAPLNDRYEVVYRIKVCRFGSAQRPGDITNETGRVISVALNDQNEIKIDYSKTFRLRSTMNGKRVSEDSGKRFDFAL